MSTKPFTETQVTSYADTLFIYRMFMHFDAPIADIVKCAWKVFVSRIASGL